MRIWHELRCNILLFDYRGYGKSEGSPGEQNCYEDAEAVYAWLQANSADTPLIFHGRSLGGGVASYLASRHPAAGLILESTFTSIPAMASHQFPLVPSFICTTRFDTLERIQTIDMPVLILHSPDDEIIPYYMGKQLYGDGGPGRLFTELRGGHNEGFLQSDNYIPALESFINQTCPRP